MFSFEIFKCEAMALKASLSSPVTVTVYALLYARYLVSSVGMNLVLASPLNDLNDIPGTVVLASDGSSLIDALHEFKTSINYRGKSKPFTSPNDIIILLHGLDHCTRGPGTIGGRISGRIVSFITHPTPGVSS